MLFSMISFGQWSNFSSYTSADLYAVFFTDASHGYVAGEGMYRWYPAGTGVGSSTDKYYSIYFTSADTGYLAGGTNFPGGYNDYGIVRTTKTAGAGLQGAPMYHTSDTMLSIFFTSSFIGYGVGPDGMILKTVDGAVNWTSLSSNSVEDLWSVCFPDANTGYVAGSSGTILKTTNGGTTWTAQSTGTTENLYSVFFTDVNNGCAVGANATILRTINGGVTWTSQTCAITADIRSVYFSSTNIGYTAGLSGRILKTVDGGASWTTLSSGTSVDLYCIHFVDDNIGYAVGKGGKMLKTVNGGSANGLEINDIVNHESVSIYPNPVHDKLNVLIYHDAEIQSIEIINLNGQLVKSDKSMGAKSMILEVSDLYKGIYFLKVKTDKEIITDKFIKL